MTITLIIPSNNRCDKCGAVGQLYINHDEYDEYSVKCRSCGHEVHDPERIKALIEERNKNGLQGFQINVKPRGKENHAKPQYSSSNRGVRKG